MMSIDNLEAPLYANLRESESQFSILFLSPETHTYESYWVSISYLGVVAIHARTHHIPRCGKSL